MVTARWLAIDVIHYSSLESNQSITTKVYCQQPDEMNIQLSKMRPALVNQCGPILLHENARPHVRMTLQKLTDLGYVILPHPLYSLDFSPTDYNFSMHLNNFLKPKDIQLQKLYSTISRRPLEFLS